MLRRSQPLLQDFADSAAVSERDTYPIPPGKGILTQVESLTRWAGMAKKLPQKIEAQIDKAGLPRGGSVPFVPQLDRNSKGKLIIRKGTVTHGPKKGKKGYVDTNNRIWIKDRAHAGDPDHWDVQEDGGQKYFRVDLQGNPLP